MNLKHMLFSIVLLVSSMSFGVEPVSLNGAVFGIEEGLYEGSGTLLSQEFFVPNIRFNSIRKISGGTLKAKTDAKFLLFTVATAQARLQVEPLSEVEFQILDLDNNKEVCGGGVCNESSCTFKASVMSGDLILQETWVRTEDGFAVKNGSQTFKGKRSIYEAIFVRIVAEVN